MKEKMLRLHQTMNPTKKVLATSPTLDIPVGLFSFFSIFNEDRQFTLNCLLLIILYKSV